MSKTAFKIIAAAAVLLAAVGCTSNGEQGKPSPTSAGTSTSGSTGSTNELPARPAELKLDGVDPCKLLTPAQMSELRLVKTVPDQIQVSNLGKSPGCSFENGLKFSYMAVLITNKGVPFWLSGSGNVDAKVVEVAGYGAAQLTFTGTEGVDCSVAVDVANGQQLHMSFDPGTEKGDTQEQMCSKVNKAAALAVETLKTLK